MKNKKIIVAFMILSMTAGASFHALASSVGTDTVSLGGPSEENYTAAAQETSPAETQNSTDTQASVTTNVAPAQTTVAETSPAETTAEQTTAAETSPVQAAPAQTEAQTTAAPQAQPSSTTTTGGSRVVGAGVGSTVVGPGIGGGSSTTNSTAGLLPADGNTSFAGRISSPIVQPVEKYSYEDMVSDIRDLTSRYGSRMQTRTVATTLDGRNIYEIVVGNSNASKHILIHAGIHAREYMTPLLVMKQMEHALTFYTSASYEGVALSTLLNNVAIHFVPMVNPDGIALSQFGISAIRSQQLRQAINDCYASDIALGRTSAAFDRYLLYWKANGRGVDLNQNFPANWAAVTGATAPSYATYKGPSALSEPESQALVNLVNSRTWSATISYHSMGNIIYWDYAGNRVSSQSHELANVVAAKTGYRLAGGSGNGGFKDWAQIKDNPVPSLTLETGSVSCPLPLSEFQPIWTSNHEVWAAVAKYAMEH